MKEKMQEQKGVIDTSSMQKPQMSTDPLGPSLQFQKEPDGKSEKGQLGLFLSDGTKLTRESKGRFTEAIKKATGTDDFNYSMALLVQVSGGLCEMTAEQRLTSMSALLPMLRPEDETEALLAGQFLTLQNSAMHCLRLGHIQDGFYHTERYINLATKLFNVANQTMQALLKYRTKGQQTVQVVHVHNEGQAIVAQNISATGGGMGKKSLD